VCELYQVDATLDDLMRLTEDLVSSLSNEVASIDLATIPQPAEGLKDGKFKRIEFIPFLEAQLNTKLPNLNNESAVEELKALFKTKSIPLPADITLLRLLDVLEDTFITPSCIEPTFVTHHPEIMSPLSKSFKDPRTEQMVAARAELFIAGREYVNCYEEENSPFEQRIKFLRQAQTAADGAVDLGSGVGRRGDGHQIDESYLEALEWGLPPTGGWGCGVDRLVMLFAGKERISDVMPFGNLRNVVAIAQNGIGRF
jgi:lysyl-tRNA synthetase, class II